MSGGRRPIRALMLAEEARVAAVRTGLALAWGGAGGTVVVGAAAAAVRAVAVGAVLGGAGFVVVVGCLGRVVVVVGRGRVVVVVGCLGLVVVVVGFGFVVVVVGRIVVLTGTMIIEPTETSDAEEELGTWTAAAAGVTGSVCKQTVATAPRINAPTR